MSKRVRFEPTFEDFLAEPEPHQDPPMPSNRPHKARCFFNRDSRYFETLEKMLRGIVVKPPNSIASTLSLDQAAATVAASNMVTPLQLQVARLPHRRFLVLLPAAISKDDVVAAIPMDIWDRGFTFHSYSPLADTSISIPLFKVWIDVDGAPLELNHEEHMARAVSSFGLYLGSMEPKIQGDCHTWSIFIATDDLALIPHRLEFKVGGMVYDAGIYPRKWIKGHVYHRDDLPPTPTAYNPPAPPLGHPPASTDDPTPADSTWSDDDDVIPMSLTALREIFRDFSPSELPADLADCLTGNKHAIQANHAAFRLWEHRREENRIATHFTEPTHHAVTPDPVSTSPFRPFSRQPAETTLRRPTTLPLRSFPPATVSSPSPGPNLQTTFPSQSVSATPFSPSPATSIAPTHSTVPSTATPQPPPTVHRTEHSNPAQSDLALLLCAPKTPADLQHDTANTWEPHLLFPELSSPSPQNTPRALIASSATPNEVPTGPHDTSPSQPPCGTARIKTARSSRKDPPLASLDAHDFLEVPLQYAEAREIMNLIGAADIPIPPHLASPHQFIPFPKKAAQPHQAQQEAGPTKQKTKTTRRSPTLPPLARKNPPINPSLPPRGPTTTACSSHQRPAHNETTIQASNSLQPPSSPSPPPQTEPETTAHATLHDDRYD